MVTGAEPPPLPSSGGGPGEPPRRRRRTSPPRLLLETHFPFLQARARRFWKFHPNANLDYLISNVLVGLSVAVARFQPGGDKSFRAYAAEWADRAMEHGQRRDADRLFEWALWRDRLLVFLKGRHDSIMSSRRAPTTEDVLARLGWSRADLVALEAAVADDGLYRLLLATDPESEAATLPPPLRRMCAAAALSPAAVSPDLEAWRSCAQAIGERERVVLYCRWGWDGSAPMTLEALGARLKLGRERVRQLEDRAIWRLLKSARTRGLLEAGGER
ncbi:MAG: hypothetical protein KGL53_07860 [Elusimicrobia bacterium]|nr:hypothetical protein [Elusimicrobiota bacterium]